MSNDVRTEYYSGPISRKGGYYIHYHQENIGRAENHSVPDIINVFKSQKQQALQDSKNAYRHMFKRNTLGASSMTLLNEVFNDDDMMTELNNQMSKALEESIRTDKIESLISMQRNVAEGKHAFSKIYNKSGEDRIKAFSDLLEVFSKCCNLLDSEQGSALAVNLLDVKNSLSKTISNVNIGKKLQKAVKDFAEISEGATIDEQRAAAAAQSINSFASLLITKETSRKTSVTSKTMQSMINHIFSDGFAEGVSSILANVANMNIDKTLLSLEGKTSQKGVIIKNSGMEEVTSGSAWGKVDIRANNVHFTIDSKGGLTGGTIDVNLGISNKTYRQNHFKGLDKRFGSQTYSSGSMGSLKEAINTLFNGKYERYLAYNTMVHRGNGRQKEAQALQDIILTRHVTRLFSSRGGSKDFAQFIIANGQVISIWDLIMQTENFVGLSHSVNKKNQAIDLSIEGFDILERGRQIENQTIRTYVLNHSLNKVFVNANVHLDKLIQALA